MRTFIFELREVEKKTTTKMIKSLEENLPALTSLQLLSLISYLPPALVPTFSRENVSAQRVLLENWL